MALGDLFKKNYTGNTSSYIDITPKKETSKQVLLDEDVEEKELPFVPDNLIKRCPVCGGSNYEEGFKERLYCCFHCGYHYRIAASDRLEMLMDEGSFEELDKTLKTLNPLNYPKYEEKIKANEEKSGEDEGIVTGVGMIDERKCVIGVMTSYFMMGSMGSVVGEKVTRAIEYAMKEELPLIFVTASGGARMQEGIISLMQMAKTSAALKRYSDEGGLYISVLTDPTTGGVTASFASLGDIILAEPGALIGFAGKRVIEQTLRQKLPDDFQTAEFLLEHGFVDKIVPRNELKDTLGNILKLHEKGGQHDN